MQKEISKYLISLIISIIFLVGITIFSFFINIINDKIAIFVMFPILFTNVWVIVKCLTLYFKTIKNSLEKELNLKVHKYATVGSFIFLVTVMVSIFFIDIDNMNLFFILNIDILIIFSYIMVLFSLGILYREYGGKIK